MRTAILLVVSLTLLSGCIFINAQGSEYYGEVVAKDNHFDVSGVDDVTVSFNAGEFRIVGTGDDEISTHVKVFCKRENKSCERIKNEISWGFNQQGDQLNLALLPKGVKSNSNVSIVAEVDIPKTKNLRVKMAAGSLGITNYQGCLNASLAAGSINAEVFESVVSEVTLKASVGETRLVVGDQIIEEKRQHLVGSKTQWSEGVGSCHLALSTKAGEVQLTLN